MDGNKEEGSSSEDRQPIPTAHEIGESSGQAEEALQVVTAVTMFRQLMENPSRTCAEVQCNSLGIRYGKFCGVGWTGCAGEKPCDDLDGCCKQHDLCVEKKGMMQISCHEKFKKCMRKVEKSAKRGFSKKCPYEVAIPLMIQGMDMAIMFSELGSLPSAM
ncbi:hypothetical protein L7F22_056845 [Adiantum nelumboides]|nr:hypothetical protein [Adiantum nelumboides]